MRQALGRFVRAVSSAALIVACGPPGTTSPTGSPASPGPPAASPDSPTATEARELVLMTHDSFALSEEVLATFEREHGVGVRVLKAGDAGAMVNQAILSREHPLADVLFGVDNTFLSRALDADIFVPYEAAGLGTVPDELELDARRRVTPIDHGDVCLNYDRAVYSDDSPTPPPASLDDLADPAYRGALVVQDPSTSSPGLAFLLATVATFGEDDDGWRGFWSTLRDNEVLVTSSWEDAYYGRFSGGSGEGDRPIVVSYASSPAAEVAFAEEETQAPPTAAVLDGCFRQVEFAGVLAGTDAEPQARAFIDFLLSRPVQEDIPLNMFVYPANADAALPDVFTEHAPLPTRPLTMPVDAIGQGRERWIREWIETVLR